MNMNKLAVAALAALSVTGVAACGSADTNTKEGRDAFLKGCTSGAPAGVTKEQVNKFCNCAVDELKKRGLNTADELKKAQSDKSTEYLAAVRICASKYLTRGY